MRQLWSISEESLCPTLTPRGGRGAPGLRRLILPHFFPGSVCFLNKQPLCRPALGSVLGRCLIWSSALVWRTSPPAATLPDITPAKKPKTWHEWHFYDCAKGGMWRPAPASVIATTLLALQKINTNLCQEKLLDISLAKSFFIPTARAFPLPTLNSLRCFCAHFPEFEINC